MRRSTKGFYTVEAAVFVPLVILAVLSVGYFMRVEGAWENCVYGALDESRRVAMKSYDGIHQGTLKSALEERFSKDSRNPDSVDADRVMCDYSDGRNNHLSSYSIEAYMRMELPAGFSRDFTFSADIKFRGFTGRQRLGEPLGSEGLEREEPEDPVWIFPYSGEKYHTDMCTYVKAAVIRKILSSDVRKDHRSCALCDSDQMKTGDIVFCFSRAGTAYHRGTCRIVNRHTAGIDRTEAVRRGFSPCSKCGGQ